MVVQQAREGLRRGAARKPARRELPIKPDYVGKTIDDRFVVGYGLDSEEVGRNYPDIYNFAN